jgi:FAD/FMN-containing dehydrogenase
MPDTALPAGSHSRLIDAIRAVVGDRGLLTDSNDTASCSADWRRLYQGRTDAVIRPATTQELAAVVKLCAEAGTPVVPQGGNTSMVGGAVPAED